MNSMDSILWDRWRQQRDPDAFAELMHRYSGMVLASCRRILGDAALAEEVTQDCFLELMQSRARVRKSLGAWLHTLAVRRSLDRVKGESRRRNREQRYMETRADAQETVDCTQDEILACLDEAIEELPAHLRELLVARFFQGQSHTDLARISGVGESTIRYRIDAGITRVRQALKRRGIVAGAGALTAALSLPAEAVPPGLLARVGKLALSGTLPVAGNALLGGGLLLKLAALLVVAALTGSGLWTGYRHLQTPSPSVPAMTAAAPSDGEEHRREPREVSTAQSNPGSPVFPPTPAMAAPGPEPRSVQGRVYDAATGVGIPGAKLRAYPMNGGTIRGEAESSAPDGRYTIAPLEDGSYSVSLDEIPEYPDPRQHAGLSVTIKDGQPVLGADIALTRGIRVSGVVTDARGKPLPGAKVGAKSPAVVNPIRTQSGEEGRFSLYLPEPEEGLMLQAQTETFESLTLSRLKLPREGLDGVALSTDQPRTASVSGLVVDGAGSGMPNMMVRLLRKDPCVFNFGPTANTDKQGNFRAAGLAAGEYAVLATPENADRFSSSEENLRLTLATGEAKEGVEIVFGEKGGLAIAGRVVDGAGQPVRNAFISCYGEKLEHARTEKDGSFLITGLESKEYSLSVDHSDYSPGHVSATAGTENLEIVLRGKGKMAGRVVRADTLAPVTMFTLAHVGGEANRLDAMLFGTGRPMESSDGTFTTGDLPAMTMTVAAWTPGFAPAVQTVEIKPDSTTEVELLLSPSAAVEGWVVSEAGNPVEGAGVYFVENVYPDQMDRAYAARTDAAGHFVLDSIPKEAVRVCACHPEYGIGVMRVPGETRLVLPAAASIEGHVENQETGYQDVTVNLVYEDAPYLPQQQVPPDPSGAFRFTRLTPGLVTVQAYASADLRHRVSCPVTLGPGQNPPVTLAFERGTATVEGTVTSGGEPVTKATTLKLLRDQEGRQETLECRPDANGQYRFEKVWSGNLTLTIQRWNPELSPQTVTDELDLVIEEGQTLIQNVELTPL
jgi:RNA polymerase sigma-70 factor (ECF subfamily)